MQGVGTPLSGILAAAVLALSCLGSPSALAQTRAATPPPTVPSDADVSPWLTNLLESLKPRVDTRLPESSRAATVRLEGLLASGKAAEALPEIDARLAKSKGGDSQGEDVQMLFLKGRALNILGRPQEAKAVYTDMTQRFPELPEPWNNLAALEVADGRLEQAKMALEAALRNDPNYPVAHENMGDLFMMMAARSYNDALRLAPQNAGARNKEAGIKSLLEARTPAPQPRNR